MFQIVSKDIATGEEMRIGNFCNKAIAEETAMRGDATHDEAVHWVEEMKGEMARALERPA